MLRKKSLIITALIFIGFWFVIFCSFYIPILSYILIAIGALIMFAGLFAVIYLIVDEFI